MHPRRGFAAAQRGDLAVRNENRCQIACRSTVSLPRLTTSAPKQALRLLSPQEGGRRAVIVGIDEDIARVLVHPAAQVGPLEIVALYLLTEAQTGFDLDVALRTIDDARADAILVAGEVPARTLSALADLALVRNCRLYTLIPSHVPAGYLPKVVWEGDTPLIQLAPPPHPPWVHTVKRLLDVLCAAAGLALTAPLLLLMMVAIRFDSPGSPIFRHERMGRGHRRFTCFKLRSMRVDAEALLERDPLLHAAYRGHHYKLPDSLDPRLTRLGRWLRRTSIDELPQLWNVLRGDMSLVGPRPIVPAELEHYRGTEHVLLSVRPGLTGEWAANGRHSVGYPRRAALELRYVRSWSLLGDVIVVLKTIRAVFNYGGEPSAG